jgi:quercetin dioxygenase-like cupin family protein
LTVISGSSAPATWVASSRSAAHSSAARALTSIETTNAPGFGPPLHRHRETEVFYVLEGRYLFEVDGRQLVAKAGDIVMAPGGTAHAFVNITEAPARQFIQILPDLDAAAFFLGLGDVMREGKLNQQALNAFGAWWHVEFLGPPLRADYARSVPTAVSRSTC